MYRASLYSAFGGKNNSDLSVLTDGDEFLGNGTTLPGNANSTVNQSPNKSHVELNATIETIIYDKNGKVLNSSEIFSGLNKLKIDKSELGEVNEVSVNGSFREKEHYRYKTVSVSDKQFPKVAYVTIAISVNQLDSANSRYQIIIITVMIIFWLLSVFASVYLANLSRTTLQPFVQVDG